MRTCRNADTPESEPLFIDSLFGEDGNNYRQVGREIVRTDRNGKPIPFKTQGAGATLYQSSGQGRNMTVDRSGNIYCANSGGVVVYDADGQRKVHRPLRLEALRGILVDAKGNIYVVCRASSGKIEDSSLEVYNSAFLEIRKYPPMDAMQSETKPLWTRPWTGITGRDGVLDPCRCFRERLHQALDGKGYLYAAGQFSVQVIDCESGRLVGEFGSYGNMDCQGKGSKYPHPELPFGTIQAISVWKDRLFVVDVLNRRIVKCRITYSARD